MEAQTGYQNQLVARLNWLVEKSHIGGIDGGISESIGQIII